jgi:CRP-like cAMP-binding protein
VADVQHQGPTADALGRRFETLRGVAIFFALSDNILRTLARAMEPLLVPPRTNVVNQGDKGDSMYVVQEGRAEVVVEPKPGHRVVIAVLGPGDFFGEMALLSQETRSATVRALEPCKLLMLDRRTLHAQLPPGSDTIVELTRLVEQRRSNLPNLIARAQVVVPEQEAVSVAVYSSKGGSGRTTMAVNLAAALARRYPNEVVLVDLALPYNHAALISHLVPTRCLAHLADTTESGFEEALLSSILIHPCGMMLLGGVLRPEEADLITPALVQQAMTVLDNAFRYVVFDLGVALSDNTLSVIEHSQRVLLMATPELTVLKDISQMLGIFNNVLDVPLGRILLAINHNAPKSMVVRDDFLQILQHEIDVEMEYDGSRPDEAALKGDILVLTEPRSSISHGAETLATLIAGAPARRKRRLPFGLGA